MEPGAQWFCRLTGQQAPRPFCPYPAPRPLTRGLLMCSTTSGFHVGTWWGGIRDSLLASTHDTCWTISLGLSAVFLLKAWDVPRVGWEKEGGRREVYDHLQPQSVVRWKTWTASLQTRRKFPGGAEGVESEFLGMMEPLCWTSHLSIRKNKPGSSERCVLRSPCGSLESLWLPHRKRRLGVWRFASQGGAAVRSCIQWLSSKDKVQCYSLSRDYGTWIAFFSNLYFAYLYSKFIIL